MVLQFILYIGSLCLFAAEQYVLAATLFYLCLRTDADDQRR